MKRAIISVLLTATIVISMTVSVFADALSDWQSTQVVIAALTQQIQTNTIVNPQFSATPEGIQLQTQLLNVKQKADSLLPQALAIAQGQASTAEKAPAADQNLNKLGNGYVLLTDGTAVTPDGKIPFSQLNSAVFVNNTNSPVYYAGIASPGIYRVEGDNADWAYEGTVAPHQNVPLAKYKSMFDSHLDYNCLTMEIAPTLTSASNEYSFFLVR